MEHGTSSDPILHTPALTHRHTHKHPEDEDQKEGSDKSGRVAGTIDGSRGGFGPLAISFAILFHLHVGSVAPLRSEHLNLKMIRS